MEDAAEFDVPVRMDAIEQKMAWALDPLCGGAGGSFPAEGEMIRADIGSDFVAAMTADSIRVDRDVLNRSCEPLLVPFSRGSAELLV